MAKITELLAVVLLSVMLLPFSSTALTQDFCVADLVRGNTPAGYICKAPATVASGDFYYHGLASAGALVPPFNVRLASAFVRQFPAVNGLGISASRVDVLPGGVVPLHTHPAGSELLFVLEGSLSAGFISAADNTVYTATVNKGNLFIFPQGLLHYQYNVGNTTAVAFAAYSSPNPGLQIVDSALFSSVLPTSVVSKVTFMGEAEVRRLKALFGGSG